MHKLVRFFPSALHRDNLPTCSALQTYTLNLEEMLSAFEQEGHLFCATCFIFIFYYFTYFNQLASVLKSCISFEDLNQHEH